jgi:hypothetical protein
MRGSFRLHLTLLLATAFAAPTLADTDPSLPQVYAIEPSHTCSVCDCPASWSPPARRGRRVILQRDRQLVFCVAARCRPLSQC